MEHGVGLISCDSSAQSASLPMSCFAWQWVLVHNWTSMISKTSEECSATGNEQLHPSEDMLGIADPKGAGLIGQLVAHNLSENI